MDFIFENLSEYLKKDDVIDCIFQLIGALIIAVAGYFAVKLVLRLVRKILDKTKIEHTVATFITSALKVVLYIFVIITILSTLGVNVTSIITAVGAAVLTAGLALQNSLSNVASGIIILFTKPFSAGDALEINGERCTVENIRIFTTTVKTFDKKVITIPNSKLTSENIINCTAVDKRRVDMKFSVSYDDDLSKVKKVITDVAKKYEKILTDPAPAAYVNAHLDSGIQIFVMVWTAPENYDDVYFYMQENVKTAFDENGITIPYPHVVVSGS